MKIGDFIKKFFPFLSKKPKQIEEANPKKQEEIRKDEMYRELCEQEGRMKNFDDYLNQKSTFKNDIQRCKMYLQDSTEDAARWKYTIHKKERMLDFLRPKSKEDIEERKYWEQNFSRQFSEFSTSNLDLRFHLTTIYSTEDILKSGGIFPSIDVFGYCAGTDPSGRISVCKPEELNKTKMQFYADSNAYHYSLPCGCIFALKPRTKLDEVLKHSSAMEAVNFKEHPEQLYAIFTTRENIPNIRTWLQEAGLNPELAVTFDVFLKKLKNDPNIGKPNKYQQFRKSVAPQTLSSQPSATSRDGATEALRKNDDDTTMFLGA